MFDSSRRKILGAMGVAGGLSVAGCAGSPDNEGDGDPGAADQQTTENGPAAKTPDVETVAADPAAVPDPIDRDEPTTHEVTLTVEEVTAEVEPGVTFDYMTFDGQVPGPMIRVRQGDTVEVTLENPDGNGMPHNVDFHAVYGTGGGADASMAGPGADNAFAFEARYPGAFIYHCAVPNMDYHISSGMFGMILVEPEGGLPEVDREFYLGQHELYTERDTGAEGHHQFDFDAMAAEEPTYVLLNGEKYAYAAANRGPLQAEVGETARVYLVSGGPNLTSNFHPIGNVWTEAYPNGSVTTTPDEFVQTMQVAPGSCFVGTMEFPVPERIKLVDHALSRVARKGLIAEVDVTGQEDESVFDPDANGTDHDGPIYE
jgi:nitrite reductase (NO-forming)